MTSQVVQENVDQPESSRLPSRIGIWTQEHTGNETWCFAQMNSTDYYRISFITNPTNGRISSFSFRFYPYEGCESPVAARPIPDFVMYDLSEQYSRKLLPRLLSLEEGDLTKLVNLLYELREAKLREGFLPDEAMFEERLRGIGARELGGIIEQVLVHSHIPDFVARPIAAAVLRAEPPTHRQGLLHRLVMNVGLFEPRGREVILNTCGEHLTQVLGISEILLNQHGRPSAILSSVEQIHPRIGNALVNYLLHAESDEFSRTPPHSSRDTIKSLFAEIHRFSDREAIYLNFFEMCLKSGNESLLQLDDPGYQKFTAETRGKVPYRLLLPYLNKSSDDAARQVFNYLDLFEGADINLITKDLLRNRRFHLTNPRMLRGQTFSGMEALESIVTKPAEGTFAHNEHIVAIAKNKQHFSNLPDQALFDAIIANHGQQEGAFMGFRGAALGDFRGLSAASAKRFTSKVHTATILLQNLVAFRLSRTEFNNLMTEVKQTMPNFIPHLLNNLDRIPDTYLKYLESEYQLRSYASECGIPSTAIYEEYRELKRQGKQELCKQLVREVHEGMDSLFSHAPQSHERLNDPRIKALLPVVFPGSENETMLEGCRDRSDDIARFKIRPMYRMNLSEGVELVLKPGATPEHNQLARIQAQLDRATKAISAADFDSAKMEKLLIARIAESHGGGTFKKEEIEQRLFQAFLAREAQADTRRDMPELLLMYQLVMQENVKNYLQMTVDRSEKAKNAEYAQMLEWHEYLGDRIRDATKVVLKTVASKDILTSEMLATYHTVRRREFNAWRDETVNRFQIDKLGLNPSLKKRLEAIRASNDKSDGSAEMAEQRMLDSERAKVATFLTAILRRNIDPKSVDLETFDAQATINQVTFEPDSPPRDELLKFFGERLLRVFAPELELLSEEIKKYVPSENQSRQVMVLEGYITKNLASVRARHCGGVCVAGDNPSPYDQKSDNQWDLPNYFQLVLRNPATKICVGLVLLHHYEVGGRKILVGSFNPSSTYVYKVDERSLFTALLGALTEFAQENDFSMICCSKHKGIRTNRTGGEFERGLDDRIREVKKEFNLPATQPFSFKPSYSLKELDVLWEAPSRE